MLKARRDNRTASTTVQASFHQVGELARELDDADLEVEEREASDHSWYEAAAGAREALAEEARADAGESKFAVAYSLRISWLVAQRSDTTLYALLANPDEKKGYRLATDGLLEKCVIRKVNDFQGGDCGFWRTTGKSGWGADCLEESAHRPMCRDKDKRK